MKRPYINQFLDVHFCVLFVFASCLSEELEAKLQQEKDERAKALDGAQAGFEE